MSADKKVILVYENQEGNLAIESVWANKVGEYYRIDSIPFFAKNLSLNDLVEVDPEGDALYFSKLISESGWSTVQLVIMDKDHAQGVIDSIERMGLSWEGLGKDNQYLALGIPPTASYSEIKSVLDSLAAQGVLDYRESCISGKHKKA